jgi:hypothetical protein
MSWLVVEARIAAKDNSIRGQKFDVFMLKTIATRATNICEDINKCRDLCIDSGDIHRGFSRYAEG